jgi:hypothetical protein
MVITVILLTIVKLSVDLVCIWYFDDLRYSVESKWNHFSHTTHGMFLFDYNIRVLVYKQFVKLNVINYAEFKVIHNKVFSCFHV